jgi:hypothetical protein
VSNPLLISPSRETPWHFETAELVRRLRERWPGAAIRLTPADDPYRALEFAIDLGGEHPVDCALTADGRAVWVERGTIDEGAIVAAWVRGLVPPEQELVLCDQAYSFDVALTPGMTRETIAAAARAAGGG